MNCELFTLPAVPAELIEAFRSRDNFLVTSHVNPDGDAIGSASALEMALRSLGKKVTLLNKHTIPAQYRFMPGHDHFHTYETLQQEGIAISGFETLVLLDCNHPERIGIDAKQLAPAAEELKAAIEAGLVSLVVDHHRTEKGFGSIAWVRPDAAATGVLVYAIIREIGAEITPEIAKNIYTAIMIDTGNFRYENADSSIFRIAADLIEKGAVPHEIYEEVYESFPDNRFRLYMKVIESIEIHGRVAVSIVTNRMLEETGTVADDTENFVSFPRLMKDVDISILIRELGPTECKASLRSKGDINVAAVAETFNGGGHKNAAGCRIMADVYSAKKMLLEKLAI